MKKECSVPEGADVCSTTPPPPPPLPSHGDRGRSSAAERRSMLSASYGL